MKLLALPEDEREIVRFLCLEEDLLMLTDDLTDAGRPHLSFDPVASVPADLPSWKRLKAAIKPGVGVTDPNYQDV